MIKDLFLFQFGFILLLFGGVFRFFIEKKIRKLGGEAGFSEKQKYVYRHWRQLGGLGIFFGLFSIFLSLK